MARNIWVRTGLDGWAFCFFAGTFAFFIGRSPSLKKEAKLSSERCLRFRGEGEGVASLSSGKSEDEVGRGGRGREA